MYEVQKSFVTNVRAQREVEFNFDMQQPYVPEMAVQPAPNKVIKSVAALTRTCKPLRVLYAAYHNR